MLINASTDKGRFADNLLENRSSSDRTSQASHSEPSMLSHRNVLLFRRHFGELYRPRTVDSKVSHYTYPRAKLRSKNAKSSNGPLRLRVSNVYLYVMNRMRC